MLELIGDFIDFVLHIDVHLREIVTDYRTWTYLIIFVIIFAETGLVVTPFLPGDSLLFAAGSIAALDGKPMNIFTLTFVIIGAAFVGDNTNYFFGKFLGKKVYEKNYKFIKREYLMKTHNFYEKHGRITIIIARFIPIIRTFAPFVAGVGTMEYLRFLPFSIAASILWVSTFCLAGYFFGNIPFVQNNFSLVIFAIIFLSILPPIYAFVKARFKKKSV